MPNDDKHVASKDCPCAPKEHEETKRLQAQGYPTNKVWVHNQLN